LLSAILKSFPFLLSIVLSTLVCGTIALVPSKMSARNKNAQIRLATSEASVVKGAKRLSRLFPLGNAVSTRHKINFAFTQVCWIWLVAFFYRNLAREQ
jgi:hypothetical protein